jgi:hypothetical protein
MAISRYSIWKCKLVYTPAVRTSEDIAEYEYWDRSGFPGAGIVVAESKSC